VLDYSPIQKLRQIKTGGMSYEMVYRSGTFGLAAFFSLCVEVCAAFRLLNCSIAQMKLQDCTERVTFADLSLMVPPDAAIKDVRVW
jgi:hypothetical protein